MPMVAWYVLSNESYMKRVIKEVFPTAVSCQNLYSRVHMCAFVFASRGTRARGNRTALFAQEYQSIAFGQ